jgi:hypothetical protein
VSEVRVRETSQGNVSRVYELAVRYEPGSGPEGLPAQLFLKIPHPNQPWVEKEAGFYNCIAPAMRDAYAVHFGGQPASIRMWADELELADRTADGTSQL